VCDWLVHALQTPLFRAPSRVPGALSRSMKRPGALGLPNSCFFLLFKMRSQPWRSSCEAGWFARGPFPDDCGGG